MAAYFIVQTDTGGDWPKVLETYTDYDEARDRCDEMRKKTAKESTFIYYVTDRDTFPNEHITGLLY